MNGIAVRNTRADMLAGTFGVIEDMLRNADAAANGGDPTGALAIRSQASAMLRDLGHKLIADADNVISEARTHYTIVCARPEGP